MPHVIIDHSANIAAAFEGTCLVQNIHQSVVDCGLFVPASIKTRRSSSTQFYVGEQGSSGSYCHVSVAILPGRTTEQKAALSEALLAILSQPLQHVNQVTVEIRELDKDSYRKQTA